MRAEYIEEIATKLELPAGKTTEQKIAILNRIVKERSHTIITGMAQGKVVRLPYLGMFVKNDYKYKTYLKALEDDKLLSCDAPAGDLDIDKTE